MGSCLEAARDAPPQPPMHVAVGEDARRVGGWVGAATAGAAAVTVVITVLP